MMLWIDIETTGLDPDKDQLLELGMALTTDSLTWVDHFQVLVRPVPALVRSQLQPVIREMHDKSGLLQAVQDEQRTWPLHKAENWALAWLDGLGLEEPPPMCGSSVHFDRSFLKAKMPKLEGRFHYRNINSSTIKELAMRWKPEVVQSLPPPAKLHRSLPDLRDSVAELRHYAKHMMGVSFDRQ